MMRTTRLPKRTSIFASGYRPLFLGLASALCLLHFGCAQPSRQFFEHAKERIAWPASPEQPRLRYLGEFAGTIDPKRRVGMTAAWNRLLFGTEEALARLVTPHAVAVDAAGRYLAIADPNAKCVHILDLDAEGYSKVATVGPSHESLNCPIGIAWLGSSLFITDAEKKRIAVLPQVDIGHGGKPGHAEWLNLDIFTRPSGLASDPLNGRLYVCDAGAHALWALDSQGRPLFKFGHRGAGPGEFNFPSHVAVASDGSIVVADSMNFRIQRFRPDGTFLKAFGRKGDAAGDFALPKGVAVDVDGRIWVVDAQFENVQAFDIDGRLLMSFGGEGQEPGMFWLPAGAATDARRRLWIADTYNRRVQAFEVMP